MTSKPPAELSRRFLILVACAGLVACNAGAPIADGVPADPAAAMRPDLLVADPSMPSPGQIVELTFPEETLRGVAFVLERQQGEAWQHRYSLVSDANGGQPVWWDAEAPPEGIGVPDVGIGGRGPDRVLIPDTAPPGSYRICTGNAVENFCAPITIAGD